MPWRSTTLPIPLPRTRSSGKFAPAVQADVADEAQFMPMQRAGSALEVAQAILWLLSDASSYTTGSLLDVTGGR